jgi:hypothetical protein
MKSSSKILAIIAGLATLASLSACGNATQPDATSKGTASSQLSSNGTDAQKPDTPPSTATDDKSAVTPIKVDFYQLLQGNYASLAGIWENGDGGTMTITGDTVILTGGSRNGYSYRFDGFSTSQADDIDFSSGVPQATWTGVGGMNLSPNATASPAGLWIAPAGMSVNVVSSKGTTPDISDTSKDRINISTNGPEVPFVNKDAAKYLYYRVSANTPTKPTAPEPVNSSRASDKHINLGQLEQGNFTSLDGKWQNGDGDTITVSGDTLVVTYAFQSGDITDSYSLPSSTCAISNGVGTIRFSFEEEREFAVPGLTAIPAGTTVQTSTGSDISDTSRDRLTTMRGSFLDSFSGKDFVNYSLFYRVQ